MEWNFLLILPSSSPLDSSSLPGPGSFCRAGFCFLYNQTGPLFPGSDPSVLRYPEWNTLSLEYWNMWNPEDPDCLWTSSASVSLPQACMFQPSPLFCSTPGLKSRALQWCKPGGVSTGSSLPSLASFSYKVNCLRESGLPSILS